MRLTGYAEIRAVLADPGHTVPPAPPATAKRGVGWLRASVARFSSAQAHERRRAIAVDQLSEVDVAELRAEAGDRTANIVAAANGPIDLMADVARVVPAELLATALGLTNVRPESVAALARAYPTGATDETTDQALDELIAACGGVADERSAARIGLLAQAVDATAGLIGNTAFAMLRLGRTDPAEAILTETLRHNPPVRLTRRLDSDGAPVELDLATANHDPAVFAEPDRFDPARANRDAHLDFGFGAHACPGGRHAIALAAGVLDAVRGCRLITERLAYLPAPNLRVPTELFVAAPGPMT